MTQEKEPPVSDRILRSITFLILFLAVSVSFVLRTFPEPSSEVVSDVQMTETNLFFRLVKMQALSMELLPGEEEQTELKESILVQLQAVAGQTASSYPEVEVQRRMILAYLGEDISGFDEKELGPYRESFHNLYFDRSVPAEGDAILSLPATELAILDFYRRNDPDRYAEEKERLQEEAASFQLLTGLVMLAFFAAAGIGIYGAARFVFHRPPPYFGRFLATVSGAQQPAFMETAILFLFLLFPVGMLVSPLIPEEWLLTFQLGFIPAAFVISLLYFRSESRPEMLRWLFWIPVMDEVESEEGRVSVKRPLIRSLIKEAGIGLIAVTVIFPIGVMANILAAALAGGQLGGPSVHPVMSHMNDNAFQVFVLAVLIAPIVEEVIFRNFIYGFFRFRFSALFSALFSGFFFAVMHPYTMLMMPHLTVLGMGLALLREHRPGIVAPVVAHMIVNGMVFMTARVLL